MTDTLEREPKNKRDDLFFELVDALKKALQLSEVATDWNLDKVEIDGKMVSTHRLKSKFRALLKKCEPEKNQSPLSPLDNTQRAEREDERRERSFSNLRLGRQDVRAPAIGASYPRHPCGVHRHWHALWGLYALDEEPRLPARDQRQRSPERSAHERDHLREIRGLAILDHLARRPRGEAAWTAQATAELHRKKIKRHKAMTIPSTITNKAMVDQTEIDGESMRAAREIWAYGLFCVVAIAGLSWFASFAFGVIW
jgi:hypothetical protein